MVVFFYPFLFSSQAFSASTLPFKTASTNGMEWLNYGLVLGALLFSAFFLYLKKNKAKPATSCRLLEKTYLNNKTIIYLLEYRQQHFLLAENPQGLCFHPLPENDK
ncbi:hypothetical protein [Legionella birminghamensis]|nr:hypothetical protein [Legionella birminghamensis]